jgi:hypothetical protein
MLAVSSLGAAVVLLVLQLLAAAPSTVAGRSARGATSDAPQHVKFLTWYMSNGKGRFNKTELDTAPTRVHANLQMASNLTFLVESSKQVSHARPNTVP